MRLTQQMMWLSTPILIGSLIGHVWLYTGYLLDIPWLWSLLLGVLLLVIAVLVVVSLRFICRSLFQRAHPPEWMKLLVTQLSRELDIPQPDLYALSTEGINAFALGDARASGIVFFHEQMLAHLTQDEVESVLAHEMVHLASRHAMLMTFMQGMTAPVIVPLAGSASLFMSILFGMRGFRQHFIQLYHMFSVLLFPVTTIMIALVMRQWEYDADARAARLVGKAKYIAALQCLHGSFFQHPDLLNLSSSQSTANNDQWALSHPSLKQRIHALRQVG